jgi:hypothetical protein
MVKAITAQFHNEDALRRLIFSFGAAFVLACMLYGVIIQSSIIKLVKRQALERSIQSERVALAELEARYIAAKTGITEEVAAEAGFLAVSQPLYAVRTGSTLSLGTALSNDR